MQTIQDGAKAIERKGQITELLDNQVRLIKELTELISILKNKLSPISRSNLQDESNPVPKMELVPIAEKIDNHNGDLGELIHIVNDIINNVEL